MWSKRILPDELVKWLFHKGCFELKSPDEIYQSKLFVNKPKWFVIRVACGEVYRPL